MTLLLVIVALTVLAYLAKRLPWFGILSGLGLIVTAIHYWQNTSAKDFRTEGSAAGGLLMIFFGLFEILLVSAGVSLICIAVASLGFGYSRKVKELRTLRELKEQAELLEVPALRERTAASGSLHQPALMSTNGVAAATLRPFDLTAPVAKPAVKTQVIDTAKAAPSPAATPEKISPVVKWFSLLVGGMFAWAGARLLLGLSNDLLCGRKSCIDFFGLFAAVKSAGGLALLGLTYLLVASAFFFVAYRAFFPPVKPKSWLDKYRK